MSTTDNNTAQAATSANAAPPGQLEQSDDLPIMVVKCGPCSKRKVPRDSNAAFKCETCKGRAYCDDCWDVHNTQTEDDEPHRYVVVNIGLTALVPVRRLPAKTNTPRCTIHLAEDLVFNCQDCTTLACTQCIVSSHNGHKFESFEDFLSGTGAKLLAEAQRTVFARLETETKDVASASQVIQTENTQLLSKIDTHFRSTIQRLTNLLSSDRSSLARIVQDQQARKLKALDSQFTELQSLLNPLLSLRATILLDAGQTNLAIKTRAVVQLQAHLARLSSNPINYVPFFSATLTLTTSDIPAINLGILIDPNVCPGKCTANGPGLTSPQLDGSKNTFQLTVRDENSKTLDGSSTHFVISISSTDNEPTIILPYKWSDTHEVVYSLVYPADSTPDTDLVLCITYGGEHIAGSPFILRKGRSRYDVIVSNPVLPLSTPTDMSPSVHQPAATTETGTAEAESVATTDAGVKEAEKTSTTVVPAKAEAVNSQPNASPNTPVLISTEQSDDLPILLVPCYPCGKRTPICNSVATVKCTTCHDRSYCDDCWQVHNALVDSHQAHQFFVLNHVPSQSSRKSQRPPPLPPCSRHPDSALVLYCKPCNELVCVECIDALHIGHVFELFEKFLGRTSVDDLITQTNEYISKLEQAIATVDKARAAIMQQCEEHLNKIEDSYTRSLDLGTKTLHGSHKSLVATIQATCTRKLQALSRQLEGIRVLSTSLQFLESKATSEDPSFTPLLKAMHLLEFRKQVQAFPRMRSESRSVSGHPPSTKETPVYFTLLAFASRELPALRLGEITDTGVCPSKCTASGKGLAHTVPHGVKNTFLIQARNEDGDVVTCPVARFAVTISNAPTTSITVVAGKAGTYEVSYSIPTKELPSNLQLTVAYCGEHIMNSPFRLIDAAQFMVGLPTEDLIRGQQYTLTVYLPDELGVKSHVPGLTARLKVQHADGSAEQVLEPTEPQGDVYAFKFTSARVGKLAITPIINGVAGTTVRSVYVASRGHQILATPALLQTMTNMLPPNKRTLRKIHDACDGCGPSDFWRVVSGVGDIVVVIKAGNGNIFGAYIEDKLQPVDDGDFIAGSRANFVFRLTGEHPVKLLHNHHGSAGVCINKSGGFQLGPGPDVDLAAFWGNMRVLCKAPREYTVCEAGYTILRKTTLCGPGVLDKDDLFSATAMEIFHCV